MSVKAMGDAWDSGYTGSQLLVMLAITDVVNDANGNLFWMTVGAVADKATVSPNTARAALQTFVDDGWLEVVGESKGRKPTEYRYLGQPSSGWGVDSTLQSEGGQPSNQEVATLQSDDPSPITNSREPKDNSTRGDSRELVVDNRSSRIVIATFDACWEIYPRKLNRKGALKAYLARVKGGANLTDLYTATKNYAEIRDGEDPVHTMHGATFFGPNDRWMDYLEPQPDAAAKPRPKQTPAQKRASRLLQLQRDREAANQRGLPA